MCNTFTVLSEKGKEKKFAWFSSLGHGNKKRFYSCVSQHTLQFEMIAIITTKNCFCSNRAINTPGRKILQFLVLETIEATIKINKIWKEIPLRAVLSFNYRRNVETKK